MEEEIKIYGNAILKYCFGILCDYHEAQDAAQETFVKAHFARKTLKAEENFKAWIYKIAYNICLNMIRKRRFFYAPANNNSYLQEDSFIDPVLLDALLILPPKDRALFYSRAVDDMDYNQLEALYSTRAATLRKRFERAKSKLKKHLEGVYTYE